MNINYSVDHKLLQIEPIKDLKGNLRIATWHTLCMIIHFSRHTGSCKFPKNQMSKSLGMKNNYFGEATKILLNGNWIKELKPYDKASQEPAIYTVGIAYTKYDQKLYHKSDKAIPSVGKVKEFQKNSKEGGYDRPTRSFPPFPENNDPFDWDELEILNKE